MWWFVESPKWIFPSLEKYPLSYTTISEGFLWTQVNMKSKAIIGYGYRFSTARLKGLSGLEAEESEFLNLRTSQFILFNGHFDLPVKSSSSWRESTLCLSVLEDLMPIIKKGPISQR